MTKHVTNYMSHLTHVHGNEIVIATMDAMLTDFMQNFNAWQFILLCLTVYAITFVVRLTVEGVTSLFESTKNFKKSAAWREWLLKISPVVLGSLFSLFARHFPYPIMIESASSRLAMGAVAGLLASTVYRELKKRVRGSGKSVSE